MGKIKHNVMNFLDLQNRYENGRRRRMRTMKKQERGLVTNSIQGVDGVCV